jgi:hypothetical protein
LQRIRIDRVKGNEEISDHLIMGSISLNSEEKLASGDKKIEEGKILLRSV